jgi:hypothetical protein
MPSSRLINSLLKVKPGISPRFLTQKIAQKDPEKKIPSIAANAIRRSAKHSDELIHLKAQLAFSATLGIFEIALNKKSFSSES